jgi:hypothetical protein
MERRFEGLFPPMNRFVLKDKNNKCVSHFVQRDRAPFQMSANRAEAYSFNLLYNSLEADVSSILPASVPLGRQERCRNIHGKWKRVF